MNTMSIEPVRNEWWGDFSLSIDQVICWSIGERQIVIQRKPSEWNVWNIDGPEPIEAMGISFGLWTDSLPSTCDIFERNLFTETGTDIKVLPALADRSIITRPAKPIKILPGEQTRLYVSTPLWFRALTSPENKMFLDIPFWRPSDSWFGPSTIEGEMCYAKHTDARLQLDLLEKRVHRAITPVNVINNSADPLVIDRFNLPVPMFNLYADQSGHFWTEAIAITLEPEDNATVIGLEKVAPEEALEPVLVAEPRIEVSKRHLIRSLSSLFA